jgi:ribonuclease Z
MGEVILLGTGDPLNHERTQTCLALPLGSGNVALLDTGSGTNTLAALAGSGVPLESVRHVFVTHRHFDHAGGLAPLLVSLIPLGEEITVHATPETLEALHELLVITIPGVEDWLGDRLRWNVLYPGKPVEVEDVELTPFEVDHGLECVGFRVQRGDFSLVYSADTRPCENVVEYAEGADVLIHEAYSLGNEAEQAHLFGHSTAAEAGEIAARAGAGRLILTHFRSSGYVNPDELVEEARTAFDGPVEAARDGMSVRF